MNFVKRAALSLVARRGKTALLLGIFVVICTLLLGGFLLQGATARQEAQAQRRMGVDMTIRGGGLTTDAVGKAASSALVERYNPVLRGVTRPPGLIPVTSDAPKPGEVDGGAGQDGLALSGVRESGMLLDFATGRAKVVSGRGITAKDVDRKVVLLERRLAEKNKLKAGSTVVLTFPDGKRKASIEVIGLYEAPHPVPSQWTAPSDITANQVYAPLAAVSALGFGTELQGAVFKISSPEKARQLRAEASRLLGGGDLRFDVNDKAYRDQVRPLQRVGAFASVLVWLISLAGTVILGLIVMLTIKERRDEWGMLLSLGEKKWKLIAQHTVEVAAVAVPALAMTALFGQYFAQQAREALLARERHVSDSVDAPGPPEVRMEPADLGRVAGIGLGISLVSTVVPGIGILRLHPRSILTDSE